MAEDEEFGSGVASVFDAIASDRKAEPDSPRTTQKKRIVGSPTSKSSPPTLVPLPDKILAKPRTGRFPGSKNGPRKSKLTGRVPEELRQAYIDWALDDRCSLSELIERALTEFHQNHRVLPRQKNSAL